MYNDARKNPAIDKNSDEFLALEKTVKSLRDSVKYDSEMEYIGVKQKATDSGLKDTIDIFKFEI